MGRPRGWATERTGRASMPSPGRPGVNQREAKQAFWVRIAAGAPGEDAALACGVSQPVGTRWFREAGGMPPSSLLARSGRYLSFAEHEELATISAQRLGVGEIARRMRRSPSTVSRELRRNAATRGGVLQYRATVAQWKAERAVACPRPPSLARTRGCAPTYKTDSPAMSSMHRVSRYRDRGCRGGGGAMVAAQTDDGESAGARSRSVADCGSTSRMMRPCGSLAKPFTRRCMFRSWRAAARAVRLSAYRPGAAGAARQDAAARQVVHHPRGDDQPASRRSCRPCRTRLLGGRDDHRPEQLCDRHLG